MPPTVNAQSADFPATYGNFAAWFLRKRRLPGDGPNFSPHTFHFIRFFFAFSRGGLLLFYFSTYKLFFPYSPAHCRTNLPNGRHNASTFPKSSELKSGPALAEFSPFRLTCITPTTFPSDKIGALMIF
jgi:hypothetical protein